jgi:hypothetical protein
VRSAEEEAAFDRQQERRVPKRERTPAAPSSAAAPAPAAPPATTSVEGFAEAQAQKLESSSPGARADRTEAEYGALARREGSARDQDARDAAELRSLRNRWRAFIERHPESPRADEARVRVVALGVEIARATKTSSDAEEARRDGAAYLDRDDAVQKDRVKALLAGLAP